jgi:hemolysin III
MDFHDPISAGLHLAFAAWAVFATLLLVRLTRRHPPGRRAAVLLYGVSVAFLYTASGLYHSVAFASPAETQFFRRLDFSAIFVLVVGSELPVFAYLLRGRLRVACTVVVAALGVAGIVVVWASEIISVPVMVGVYAGLAAVGLLPVRQYARRVGPRGLAWLFASVSVYAVGGACEVAKWPVVVPGVIGPHEILHVTDILGTLAHFGFVVRFVLPAGRPTGSGGSPASGGG